MKVFLEIRLRKIFLRFRGIKMVLIKFKNFLNTVYNY